MLIPFPLPQLSLLLPVALALGDLRFESASRFFFAAIFGKIPAISSRSISSSSAA